MLKKLVAVSILSMAAPVCGAFAQTEAEEEVAVMPPPSESMIVEQEPELTLSRDVLGADVIHEEHGQIGWLESLLFNEEDEIVGGVVGFGGFLGIGSKQVALSWDEFEVRPQEKAIYLTLTQEQLAMAPSFKDLSTIEAEEAVRQADLEYQRQLQQEQQPLQ
ncbi:MAG: PRC-barrel domain-containing protein [Rhizobiaceae bacterium]